MSLRHDLIKIFKEETVKKVQSIGFSKNKSPIKERDFKLFQNWVWQSNLLIT